MVRSHPAVTFASTGHEAMDHRLFDKEACTLAAAGVRVSVVGRHPRRETVRGVELVPLPPARSRFARFLVAPWQAFRILRRRRDEIVWVHDAELLVICPLLKLLGQRAIVYDVHEDFANLMLRREWIPRALRPLVRRLLRGLERALVHSTDAVVSVTQGLVDEFPHARRVALYNLPSQTFTSAAADAPPASQRTLDVVHLGTLSPERLEFLADVLARLAALRGSVHVRLIGLRPGQRDWLQSRLPAAVEARLDGPLPYVDVPAALAECRLGLDVHPVLYPHLRYALPVKVVEYMSAGCGVVSSYLPELDRLLPPELHGRLTLLRSTDPADYALSLAAWLDDPAALDEAAAALRQAAAKDLNWESQAPKLLRLYASLANGGGGRWHDRSS
jgi:glycosyltransferase involved in cell wall biosynthesis